MKKLMVVLVAALCAGLACAKGVEQVSVVENEIATITVPFGITSYLPSNKDVVRIEEVSGTSLRITALRRGRCDLEVRGDKELSQKFEISVVGDLATTLDTLTSELDRVQEVRANIVGESIRIDGEVASIQKWEYLQKVLRNYPNVIHNFAIFSPGPDVMLRLKETLQEAGFAVVFQSLGKDRKTWPANTVALVLNKQTQIMSVQGRLYTPEQKAKVIACLSTERWLSVDLKPAADSASAEEFKIRAQLDVFVDRPQIRLSVAYMAIDDNDLKQIGNQNATERGGVLNVGGLLDSLAGVVKSRGAGTAFGGTHSASYDANITVIANFLKQNKINRVSETGYTVLESWDKNGASFKSGGTLYVRTLQIPQGATAAQVTGNAEMKEIEYGFLLNTVGGVAEDGVTADMMVDFSISQITSSDAYGVDRTEEKTKQKMLLPIGKTTFLGGRKMIDDRRTSPSGLPYLRNTPLLNWFVSDSGTTIQDRRLVIMVCPEIVDNARDGSLEVEKEINIPVSTEGVKTTEQREEEKRPYSGGLWNPLNWFVF